MSKKFKLITILLIIIVTLAAIGVYAISRHLTGPQYTYIDFDEKRAYLDSEAFSKIGPRLTGTDGEYRGAVYIREQFTEAGLDSVHIEEYEELLYEVNSASVGLVQYLPFRNLPNPLFEPVEYEHTVDFVVQGYSGSYEWNGYPDDLDIVDVEDGKDEGLWEEARDKAAILTKDVNTASNTEVFFTADDHGVAAVILHNHVWGAKLDYIPISKSTGLPAGESSYPDIPFFMVSMDMGEDIKDGIDAGMKLRLDFDVTVENRDLRVVIGDIKGKGDPDRYVMLGAHHDTVYNGPGAVDNTVGTVTIVELARQLVKHDPERTIRLVTWGGEEEGLFGSYDYFEAHEQDVTSNCMMYLNFDMNNVDLKRGNALPLTVSDNESIGHMQNIADGLVRRNSDFSRYKINIGYDDLRGTGSDQLVFARNGIRVAAAWGSGSREYHTYQDTIEHVNPESLALSGRIFGTYALYLANK